MQIPIHEGGSWAELGPVVAYAEVDEADYAGLSQYRWHLSSDGYAVRTHQPPTPAVCPECGWTPPPHVHLAHSVASHRGKMHKAKVVREKRYTVSLHRQVLGLAPGDPRQGDHVNRNRLDNRRSNLRITPPGSIQTQNRGKAKSFNGKPTESAYRGVYMVKKKGVFTGRWKAEVGGTYLGCFTSEIEAAAAAAAHRRETMPFSTD
jgi:hypothetical protein